MHPLKNLSPHLLLAGPLTLCYLLTLAPGLSWANRGADGGDLISAALTGGIPHPAGYPLYLLAARLFQTLPFGALAFRTNLLSAVCTVLAALMLQTWLARQLGHQPFGFFAAYLGALAFGLSPLVWGQAVITEVYGLHSLLILVFLMGLDSPSLPGGDWIRGLLLGLAASNHLTSLLLLPLLALDFSEAALFVKPAVLLKRAAGLLVGLLLYLTLPLRALAQPPINWGNPVTLTAFWWLISGKMYGSYPLGVTPDEILLRLRGAAGLLLMQFGIPEVLVGIYGFFANLPRRILVVSLWLFSSYSLFAILYGSYDSQVYLIPACLAFAIWLAYGLSDLLQVVSTRFQRIPGWVFCAFILALLILRLPSLFPQVDASHDTRAEAFGEKFAAVTPAKALVIANGDETVFALWYFHFALGQRPDVTIVSEQLLPFDWYLISLGQTYPELEFPAARPVTANDLLDANPTRPSCFVEANTVIFCQ